MFASIFTKDGKSQGKYILDFLFSHLVEIKDFSPAFPIFNKFSVATIEKKIRETIKLVQSPVEDTDDEIREALPIFKEQGVEKIIIISSPDHVSRVAKLVQELWRNDSLSLHALIRSSKTLYGPKTDEERKLYGVEFVRIHEIPVTRIIDSVRLFKILKNPEAISEVDKTLKRYGA